MLHVEKKMAKRDYQEIVDELSVLLQDEDKAAFRMGDVFVEIEDTFGKDQLWSAAKSLRITETKVRQRLWVSRKIPEGHKLRNTHLSYSHLREIAGTDDMEHWADVALKGNLTVAQLSEQIDYSGTKQAIDGQDVCALESCKNPLVIDNILDIVSFRIGKEKKRRCCSVACAAKYFTAYDEDDDELDITDVPVDEDINE